MADVEIRFDDAALYSLLRGPGSGVAKDLERRANRVEGAAKRLAPVDTGRLRSSITHHMGEDGQGLFVDIGSDVEYAVYQELGTLNMDAQPFLRPALSAAGESGGEFFAVVDGGD